MPLLGWLSGQPAGEDLAVTESGVRARSDNPRSRRPCARLVADSQRSSITSATAPGGPWNAVHHSGRPPGHTRLVGLASTSTWPQYLICTPMAASLRDRVARRDGQSARWMMWMAVSVLPLLRALITTSVSFPSDLVGSRPPSMTVWSLVTYVWWKLSELVTVIEVLVTAVSSPRWMTTVSVPPLSVARITSPCKAWPRSNKASRHRAPQGPAHGPSQ